MILYMNMDVNNIIENIYFYGDANGSVDKCPPTECASKITLFSTVTTVHVPMSLRARTAAQSESTYTCTNEPVWARTVV